jgi:hypothetical protein
VTAGIETLKQRAGIVGLAALGLCGVGLVVAGKDQFFRSYLLGFVFWLGIAFGCMAIQMIHALTGGRWGPPIRRTLYAASSTLPLFALLFLPLLLGMQSLYPWARPEAADDHLLAHKAPYLNVPFFAARALVCLAIWSALALVLYKRSVRYIDRAPSVRMRMIAGPGILIGALTMSVAAIDWLMSLDPHWASTMFPVIIVIGQMLSGMSFAVALLVFERRRAGAEVPIDPLHDLGNLMLLFVMLWAYVSYSQYLIIYAGNIAEETPFYVHRTEGGWQSISLALIVLHFGLPFLLLISRRTKRSPQILGALALGILVMRFVEIFWIIAPNFYTHHLSAHWMDFAATVAIGGIWAAYFLHRFGRKELVPRAA